jgi:hypothetical protein
MTLRRPQPPERVAAFYIGRLKNMRLALADLVEELEQAVQ